MVKAIGLPVSFFHPSITFFSILLSCLPCLRLKLIGPRHWQAQSGLDARNGLQDFCGINVAYRIEWIVQRAKCSSRALKACKADVKAM